MAALRTCVRELRQGAGLLQQDLAATVGVSRQGLSAIESGEVVPSTAIALELARALGCRVEDLFTLAGHDEPVRAIMAPTPDGLTPHRTASGGRARLGLVRGNWIAHLLDGDSQSVANTPADALVTRFPAKKSRTASISTLRDADTLRTNLLIAGCDPALGLLGAHLLDGAARVRLHWIEAASEAALDALADGLVHVAGLHLVDEVTGEPNTPAVRARFAGRPMLLVHLATWQQGFAVRRGERVRRVADLGGRKLRVMLREPGSGAQSLLDRLLARERIPRAAIRVAGTARGHHAVARSVAQGTADVGVSTAAAAAVFGLDFVPLAEDVFDLVMPSETAQTASGQRLLETMTSRRFHKDVGALPGYGTSRTGKIVAQLAA